MRRALLALLLLASPAGAAVHYVTPVSSFTWAESTNPATPTTLTVANANAAAGDVIQLYAGDYAAQGQSISPAAHGSAGNYITYVGSLTNPYSVSGPLSLSKRYISVKGISTTGATVSGNADSISYCTFSSAAGAFWITPSTDVVVERNTFSIRQLAVECSCVGSPACVCVGRIERLTFRYNVCTINFTCGATYEGPTFFKGLDSSEIAFNFFDLTIGTGCNSGNHFRMIYHCANNYWHDNFWRMKNNGTTNSLYARHMRDSTRFQSFARDTLVEDLTGLGHVKNTFNGSGNLSNTVRYSRTDSCLIDLGGEPVVTGDNTTGHTFRYNVLINRGGGRAIDINNDADSLTFDHNTAITTQAGVPRGAFNAQEAVTATGWTVKNNIFHSRQTGTGAVVVRYEEQTFVGDTAAWVNNLYWASTGSTEPRANYAIYRNGPGAQTLTNFYLGTSRERGSVYGPPRFTDSTYAWTRGQTTNAFRPGPGTFAAFGPDGYVGAVDPNSVVPPGDTDPPAQINDLSGAALGTDRVSIAWTASGDDGRSGVASNTYIRRHSSAISDESAWSAATPVATITTASNSTGGEQQSYQITGLTANTTYWIAVRSADEIPNTGGISNTISLTTSATPDTMPPSPVNNLTASALTSTSVQLTWTAPGGDRSVGRASTYLIRYRAGTTLTEAQWAAATNIAVNPTPNTAGSIETWTVGGLSPSTTYTFALKTSDNVPNESVISNGATVMTQGTPAAPPGPLASFNRRRRR